MKKTLLAVICLLVCAGLHAQTVVTGHISTTAANVKSHDSTMCESTCTFNYITTIDISFVGDSVIVKDTLTGMMLGTYYNTTGASPWTFTAIAGYGSTCSDHGIGGWVPGFAHFYMVPFKIIYNTDTQYISGTDSFFVTDPCEYDYVTGDVYIDNNGNCVHDIGEAGVGPYEIEIMDNVSSPVGMVPYYVSSTGPTFGTTIQKSWMTSYTVSMPAWYSFIFGAPACSAAPYTYTTLPMTGVDFPLLCTTSIDVQCDMLTSARVRAHMPFFLHPYVSNIGCDTASGVLTLIKDSRTTYDASLSTYPADAVFGDTLVWNYYALTNVGTGAYWNSFISSVHLTPDMTVSSGDTLCFRVYTGVLPTDINAANNANTLCVPVVYSFDPNVKEVSPKGDGPSGFIPPSTAKLTYTLHFQNTGTAEAYDIKVIDTLDGDVDPGSLKILGNSHVMTPKWLAPNVVQFTFNNIMLPDSTTNEPASHGSVKFSVALQSGLTAGTQIKNTGYIYFDLNPPVVTNTALNTIAIPTAVQDIAPTGTINVYPNPATDKIYLEGSAEGELWIMGLNGSVITKQHMTKGKTMVDISALPAGVYMVKAVNDASTKVTRFTKL